MIKHYSSRASLGTVTLFPHYRHLKSVPVSKQIQDFESFGISNLKEIERMLFAPDPVTGIPRSDIAAIMSKDLSPEIRDYINNVVMHNGNPNPSPAPDADMALVSIKDRRESVVHYAERLQSFFKDSK